MGIENVPDLDPRFVRALLGEDEIGVVVRSHIFVEANINEYLELVTSAPEYLAKAGLRYQQRVLLACALGFDSRFKAALLGLGAIRNAFSHKLDSKLTDSTVNSLYSKLPSFGKEAVHISHEYMKDLMNVEEPIVFEELSARDKFILIALNLERVLMAAVLMVKSAGGENIGRSSQ